MCCLTCCNYCAMSKKPCKIKIKYTLLCKRAKQICFGCIQVTACLLLSPPLFFAFVFLYLHLHSSVAPSCTCAHSISLSDEMQNVSYAEVDLKKCIHTFMYFTFIFVFLFVCILILGFPPDSTRFFPPLS